MNDDVQPAPAAGAGAGGWPGHSGPPPPPYHPGAGPPWGYPPGPAPPSRGKPKPWIFVVIAAVILLGLGVLGTAGYFYINGNRHTRQCQSAPPSPSVPASRQTVLSFAGVRDASGVAVEPPATCTSPTSTTTRW